ncbi:MAG: HAMP domain-containing sensor histidine kinase [Deltaproteobacteria bacterium]
MLFQPIRLRTVLLISLGSALLLSNALTWYIGQKRQVEGLRNAYFERIYWISESLAAKTTEWVGTANWAQLEINFNLLDSQPELVYVFVRSMENEILYAYDDNLIEEYEPEVIEWEPSQTKILDTRNAPKRRNITQTGDYQLREQILLTDALIDEEVRGKAGEVVFEARRQLVFWGDPVGIMHIGLSQHPLDKAVEENQRSLLIIEALLILFGLIISVVVARRVATPIQQLTTRLALLKTDSLRNSDSLQQFESQLQDLELADIPANTWESHQLVNAFQHLQNQLLLQIQLIQESAMDLQTSHEELKQAYDELQQMQQQLVQSTKMASMGEMLAMIAHQWRQPLATINMIASSIKLEQQLGNANTEGTLEKLKKIQDTTSFLSRTINDFRDFFRPDRQRAFVQLNELVQRTMEIIGLSLQKQDIELVKEFGELPPLELFPNEVQQALINLFKNAEEALEESGTDKKRLIVRTYVQQDKQILEVQDNAGGIPEDVVDQIFFPYFSTKNKLNGTGLGLYMSRMIIEDHLGGKLTVVNKDGGACFRVELNERLPENAERNMMTEAQTINPNLSAEQPGSLLNYPKKVASQ